MAQGGSNAPPVTIVDGHGNPISRVRSPRIPPANPNFSYTGVSGGTTWGITSPEKGGITLRKFSERNVWVRAAINRRKKELSRAEWAIVRLDDARAEPDPSVVKAVSDLFRF